MAWMCCHSAQRCYLPAYCAYLSCPRAALGGGLFNLRPTTPTRVWGVLFLCHRLICLGGGRHPGKENTGAYNAYSRTPCYLITEVSRVDLFCSHPGRESDHNKKPYIDPRSCMLKETT